MKSLGSPSSHFSPMEDLLVRLCRREAPQQVGESVIHVLTEPGAPTTFLELAQRHGVQGLVLSRLQEIRRDQEHKALIPDSVLTPFPFLQRQAVFWEMEQDRVLSFVCERGFEVLLLKGGALRHTVYRFPVERPMADLDLLVSPIDVVGMLEALAELGYGSKYPKSAQAGFREHHYHERVTHPNGFEVEVHWGLTRPSSPFRLSPDWFLRRGKPMELRAGRSVNVPSPEDMALHLVSQSEHSRLRKLSRLVDLDRVVTSSVGFDWEYYRERGREGRLSTVSALTLRLANLLLGTPAPGFSLQGSEVSWVSRKNIELLQPTRRLMNTSEMARWVDNSLLRFWCLPTWKLRWHALREVASDVRDPLSWVWEEKDAPGEEGPALRRGITSVLKILGYQMFVGTRWISATVFRVPRQRIRFWMPRERGIAGPDAVSQGGSC